MVQDIAPKILHIEYVTKEPNENDRMILFSGNEVLLKRQMKNGFCQKKGILKTGRIANTCFVSTNAIIFCLWIFG